MAIALSHPRICLQKYANFRQTLLPKQVLISISKSKPSTRGCKTRWALRSGSGEQSQDLKRHVDYLRDHFSRFCDDGRGIDVSMFGDHFVFSDPITKHDTIDGHLFNVRLVNALFHPKVQIHSVRQKNEVLMWIDGFRFQQYTLIAGSFPQRKKHYLTYKLPHHKQFRCHL